ncbi:MAG: hypothetical protein ACK5MD_06980 [Flavobacteriales bacterium]
MEKKEEITKTKKEEKKTKKKPVLLTKDQAIQDLKEDAYYKVFTDKTSYKIRYKKADQDSIYGHKKDNEKKTVSFAKKDIENIKDRRFSKLNSDLITFPILGGLIIGLILLIS